MESFILYAIKQIPTHSVFISGGYDKKHLLIVVLDGNQFCQSSLTQLCQYLPEHVELFVGTSEDMIHEQTWNVEWLS